MSVDDIDRPLTAPAFAAAPTPPFYRDVPDGSIELVVPDAAGRCQVHQIPLHLALIHLLNLSLAITRRYPRAVIPPGREPA